MAASGDELEKNSFFKALQTKYHDNYLLAQKKTWVICVPCQSSLKNVKISQKLIDCHILKPSPFFKSHYVSTGQQSSGNFELDDDNIKTPSGLVKILAGEVAYNADYKPFKILTIERPLNYGIHEKIVSKNVDDCSSSTGNNTQTPVRKNVLESFPENRKLLDKKLSQFQSSYMILPHYLHDTAQKLQEILKWAIQLFLDSHDASCLQDQNLISEIESSLESYVLKEMHCKIFPVIKKKFEQEDKEITKILFSLYEAGLTPDQLGVKDLFCGHTPSAVVELASLNSKGSPTEKLICLMSTLELLNQDIQDSLRKTLSPLNSSQEIPHIASDDLIPLLINVMVQARPLNLGANLFYVQNFTWHLSTRDKLSFSLVTFQAAKEFLKSSEMSSLKPSTSKIKKEISLNFYS